MCVAHWHACAGCRRTSAQVTPSAFPAFPGVHAEPRLPQGACWGSVLATGPARYPEHFPAPQRRRPAQAPLRAPLGGTDQAGYRMRRWHRSSGFRPLPWTELGTATAPTHVHTCARDHGATDTGQPPSWAGACLPVPICVPSCSDASSSVCSARQRAGTAGQRAVPGPHCRPRGSRSAAWCASSLGLCPPLHLEVGSLLPVCRRPWGQASDSVQLTGRGHASGDAMLFLVLTSGPWPAPRAASCEGEQAVRPVAPPDDAAGGTPPTHSSALAAPAPDVWESPFPDGPPAGAARHRAVRPACLPSPGGHRGGCRLFDDTTSEPRAWATRIEVHLQRGSRKQGCRSGLSTCPFARPGQPHAGGRHLSADHGSLSFSKLARERQCLKWLKTVPAGEGLVCKHLSSFLRAADLPSSRGGSPACRAFRLRYNTRRTRPLRPRRWSRLLTPGVSPARVCPSRAFSVPASEWGGVFHTDFSHVSPAFGASFPHTGLSPLWMYSVYSEGWA